MTPSGILAAAITPRRGLKPDVEACAELADFLASKGVAGLVLFGSTGEFVHFDVEERASLTAALIKRSKLPVLVNVSHSTLDGAIELSRRALGDGAAAAVAMPPYYFRYTQPQLRDFFMRLGDAVKGPLSLYNIPLFTTELARETACELLMQGRFCALKDSSGDNTYLRSLQGIRGPKLYVGSDPCYRQMKAEGIDGAVSGVSSVAPEVLLAIDRAVATGNNALADKAERLLSDFLSWFVRFPIPSAISMALEVRCGLSCPPAVPLVGETAEFRAWLKDWFQEVETTCKI